MNKAALLIGINKYKNYPSYTLHGCVNDVKNIKNLLMTNLGFYEPDIKIILDTEATKANILYEASKLVVRACEGELDYIFISNSSHGTQQVSGSLDEPDGLDEVYCPYDINEKYGIWDKDTIIMDDEWYNLFKQLPAHVVVEFVADCCHSGDSLRAADMFGSPRAVTNRFMPPPFMLGEEEFSEKLFTMKPTHKEPLPNVILWAGCKSDQTSADAYINNNYNGAFSFYFCKNYAKGKFRKQHSKAVREELAMNRYDQEPPLECEKKYEDKPLGEI